METVSGSTLNEAMRLQENNNIHINQLPNERVALSKFDHLFRTHLTLFGSLSNSMNIVQARSPHGSLSDIRMISAAMR